MRPDETGSITLWFCVLAGAMLVLLGLVWAGGEALTAKSRAESQAFAAARAGAEALSTDALATGTLTLDPTTAQSAAQNSLAGDGATGTVEVYGTTVDVTVSATVPGGLLQILGVDHLTVTGSASSTATPGS